MLMHILEMAKYDVDYDIRCRARLLNGMLVPENPGVFNGNTLTQIFLTEKPTIQQEASSMSKRVYTAGSLSLLVQHSTPGYMALEDFPKERPDPSVRHQTQPEKAVSSHTPEVPSQP